MQSPNISRLDLNLFVVFEAIYREGSITRAARLVNLSQPAVSHALGRLREQLDDPLFERRGREMVPTVRARALIAPVREALQSLQGCVAGASGFDPASSRRTFLLGLRDGLEPCPLPPLMRTLAAEAPGTGLQSLTVPRRDLASSLAAGRLDLALDIQLPVDSDTHQRHLLDLPLVLMLRDGHPLCGRELTLEDYLSAAHVLVSSRHRGPGLEDFGLAQAGYHRTVVLRCQHYQSAMTTVARTDLLLTLPAGLGERLAPPGVVLRKLPLALPSLSLQLYWHRDHEADPAHGGCARGSKTACVGQSHRSEP